MFVVRTIFLLLSILLASCSSEPVVSGVTPDVVEKGDTARRTLLIYIMAENSLNNFAALDVEEIVEAASGVPRDCRLFVYVDDNKHPLLTQYFRMTNGEAGNSNTVLFTTDVCSSDTAVLGSVLDYILKDYPTEVLDIVMWSHGSGWLRGALESAPQRSIGIDNGNNSYSDKTVGTIEIEELAALVKRLPAKVGRLMFDACFMQCVESCYALRGVAEWIIASPAEIPGYGAMYSEVLPCFFAYDGPEEILTSYVNAYEGKASGAVLSAVRTEGMQRLADVTYSYVIEYFNTAKKRDYSGVFSYLPGGKYNASPPFPSFFDMNAIMQRYLTEEKYVHWREALDQAVIHVESSPRWYSDVCKQTITYDTLKGCGMSIYMPQNHSRNERLNADFRTTEWYTAAGWREAGW